MRIAEDTRREAASVVTERLGLDLPDGRLPDLDQALMAAVRSSPFASVDAYLIWLRRQADESPEWRRLASSLTVGETHFFRDQSACAAIEHHVLPALVEAASAKRAPRLRFWSAGCATGEEPYSLAILLDRMIPGRASWTLTILATDVNGEALAAARKGIYRPRALRETPAAIIDRYFSRAGPDSFELDPRIRQMVTFAPINLAGGAYPSFLTDTNAMDLILCRNVLMYLAPRIRSQCVARFHDALVPGGWFIVSPAEASNDLLRPLIAVQIGSGAIFHRKKLEGVSDPCDVVPPEPEPAAPTPRGILPHLNRKRCTAKRRPLHQPCPVTPSLDTARRLGDRGHLEAARRECESALTRQPLDPEAHILYAAICQELGDAAAVLDGLRRAIYLAPDSGAAFFILGTFLVRSGKRSRGRHYLETAVKLLGPVPSDEVLFGSGGLTAGRLRETALAYLESK